MTIKYGLRNKKTGKRIHLSSYSNKNADFCNDRTFTMTNFSDERLFEVDTLDQMIIALNFNTPWYNSTEYKPEHGQVVIDDCEVIKIEYPEPVVTFTDIKKYPKFEIKYCFDLDKRSISKYIDLVEDKIPVWAKRVDLIKIPEGETVESLQRFNGEYIPLNDYIYKAFKFFHLKKSQNLTFGDVTVLLSCSKMDLTKDI